MKEVFGSSFDEDDHDCCYYKRSSEAGEVGVLRPHGVPDVREAVVLVATYRPYAFVVCEATKSCYFADKVEAGYFDVDLGRKAGTWNYLD